MATLVSLAALRSQIVFGIDNFRKGATAPANSTLGSTPTVPSILFSATAELLSGVLMLPLDLDRAVDMDLILIWALAAAQTNGDTLDVTVDYTVPLLSTGGAGPGKTSTQIAGQITAITGELAIGDPYAMTMPLARADASNPYTSGDAVALAIEIGLTNITGVASAHFLGGCLAYDRIYE